MLSVAVLTWVIAASLPFLGLNMTEMAVGTTAIVIVGEAAFWLSVYFLGAQYWNNIKAFFTRPFRRALKPEMDCTTEA